MYTRKKDKSPPPRPSSPNVRNLKMSRLSAQIRRKTGAISLAKSRVGNVNHVNEGDGDGVHVGGVRADLEAQSVGRFGVAPAQRCAPARHAQTRQIRAVTSRDVGLCLLVAVDRTSRPRQPTIRRGQPLICPSSKPIFTWLASQNGVFLVSAHRQST